LQRSKKPDGRGRNLLNASVKGHLIRAGWPAKAANFASVLQRSGADFVFSRRWLKIIQWLDIPTHLV
jgi:hypothetical protein